MLPILHIGPLAIQLPGLLLLLGLWLGLSLAEKHSHRYGIAPNKIYTISIAMLGAAVISARLIYVIKNLSAFAHNLSGIISLNLDLFDPWGALLGVGLVAIYFIRRDKLNPWSLLDALTPALAVMLTASNLSNLASGKGFGAPSSLPWAIYLYGDWRHPTQLYETLAAGIVLAIYWPGTRNANFRIPGMFGLCVIAAAAAYRLFLEAFRGDSILTSGGFRSAQLITWLILAFALGLISNRLHQPTQEDAIQSSATGPTPQAGNE
jgi:phosphatidylglycerol:prolipoprotein diacylglycerol transferase